MKFTTKAFSSTALSVTYITHITSSTAAVVAQRINFWCEKCCPTASMTTMVDHHRRRRLHRRRRWAIQAQRQRQHQHTNTNVFRGDALMDARKLKLSINICPTNATDGCLFDGHYLWTFTEHVVSVHGRSWMLIMGYHIRLTQTKSFMGGRRPSHISRTNMKSLTWNVRSCIKHN